MRAMRTIEFATALAFAGLEAALGYLPTSRNCGHGFLQYRPVVLTCATTTSSIGGSMSSFQDETNERDESMARPWLESRHDSGRQQGVEGFLVSTSLTPLSPSPELSRQLLTAALVGLLWLSPPLLATMTMNSPAAWAASSTSVETVVVPTEKKKLDEARVTLSASTKRAAQLTTDLELARTELSGSIRAADKAQQTATKLLKTVDAEVEKLLSLKKTGDRVILGAQKDRIAVAKNQLSEAQESLRNAIKTQTQYRAQVDSLTKSLKQTEATKARSKEDIAKYEKSYRQYLEKEKKIKEKQNKDRQEALRRSNEAAKKAAEEEKKRERQRIEKERKQAEKEKERRIKETKARQEAAKKSAAEAKKKEAAVRKKAEQQALKDRENQARIRAYKEKERQKQAAVEKEAKIKAEVAAKKKAEALKAKIAALEEQKGGLIIKDAPEEKIKAVDDKIAAVKAEIKSLTSKK